MVPLSETKTLTGGQLVVETLRALGVEAVFGVPGGQTLAITDAILDTPEIRFVTARHEGAAACMADAVGRLTRRPGVCIATTGPGATNLLTGIGGAYRDSSPVIAITCNNRLPDLDRDDAQNADHVSIFRPLVKWAKLVSDPRTIQQALEEAYLRATTGCPGPVLVDFARDVLESSLDPALLETVASASTAIEAAQQRPLGDPERIEQTARLLREARRPVLWLGNGAKLADAGAVALELAEQVGMPVITTFNGMGVVPTTHPLVYGALTRMGTELSSRALADADLLLAVGNSLNAISTGRWTMQLPQRIVQVDVEPAQIARYYAGRTLSVVGDARAVLSAVGESLRRDGGDAAAAQQRRARLDELSAARGAWLERAEQADETPQSGTIAPAAVMRAVRDAVPDETLAIFDAGNPGVWSYLWEIRKAGTYLKPVGFGNMGFALPAAIAAGIQNPQTPIVAFVGDGSLGMTLGELETLARERVPACLIVMNDSGYGNIRQEQWAHFGADRAIGVDFDDVDYAAVAQACGIESVRVTDPTALAEAVRDGVRSGAPRVVEALIDPAISAWTYPLFRFFEPEG
ncbi:thiamine pyrophosphate-binding protein [Conexibacter sp. CPCC 206217]|uniref:thiamine pyrophosphate-binding protein n=1 Tax=Conexibacter sp. CPCC 206217 TaxID=3064574 RepID=UPI0027179E4E|nr:thiamine pyrophosphate-binding protein [Conexibacter sp. CPCC 206217]MDO8211025.1 thiamine pyrophosphate-binding protein [Conexibacter sp. CPCC 206217]